MSFEIQHGDYLSAWCANVAERLTKRVMAALKENEAGRVTPDIFRDVLRRRLEYVLTDEGQRLIRAASAGWASPGHGRPAEPPGPVRPPVKLLRADLKQLLEPAKEDPPPSG